MKYKETVLGRIPESWDILPIKEVTRVVTDYVANGSFASLAENVIYRSEEDVAVIIRLVDYNRDFHGEFVFIDESAYEFLSKSKLFGGEIIISNVGANVGTVFRCPQLPYKMSLAPNAIMVQFIGNDDFYFHWLRSHAGQQMLKSLVTGSAQPKFNKTNFRAMSVPVPPLETQDKIASILNALDDKIELNKKINKNLEEQAVTLFKNLFDNADSFIESSIGNLPSDFEVTKVGQIPMCITDYVANGSFASLKANVTLFKEPNFAYFIRNTDLKSDSFSVYVDNHSYDFLSKSKLFGGEIIISNVGDVGSVFLCPTLNQPMTLGNNIIMLRPDDEELRLYLYIWFKHAHGQALIQGIKGGSAQPKFNKTDFKNLPIAIPNKSILLEFNEVISPMFEIISSNKSENKRLTSLRDSLLPRLMSGEIDVSDIDI